MDTKVQEGKREPLTYANAPTHIVDGIEFVDDEAALELARGAVAKYEGLLARLAQE